MKYSKLIPGFLRKFFEKYIYWAGYYDTEEYFKKAAQISVYLAFFTALLVHFIYLWRYYPIYYNLLLFFPFFYIYFIFIIFLSVLLANLRAKEIEEVLPDVLFLIASNLRAGMTIDKAVWYSARKEFGIIGIELKKVAMEIYTGVPFIKAFKAFSNRFKSDILKRVVDIMIQGVISGGDLAPLLERIAIDIRSQKTIEKEASSSVGMYIWFIVIASVLLAPILFSTAISLVEIMIKIGSELETGMIEQVASMYGVRVMGVSMKMELTPSDLRLFSMITLILINFFSSLLIGEIKEGNFLYGIKFLPFFILISLGLYFLGYTFMQKLFEILTAV